MEKRGVEGNERNDGQHDEASSAASRMLRAVNSAAIGGGNSADELDAAAKALVTQLRAAHHPPEQVLLQIKQILADAGLRPSHGASDGAVIHEPHATLYRSVIESSIRYYFSNSDGNERANV